MFKSIVLKKVYLTYIVFSLCVLMLGVYNFAGLESNYDEGVISNLNKKVNSEERLNKSLKMSLNTVNGEKNKFYGKSIDNLTFKKELNHLCKILSKRRTLSTCYITRMSSSKEYVNVSNAVFITSGKKDNLVLKIILSDMYNIADYTEQDKELQVNFYKKQ